MQFPPERARQAEVGMWIRADRAHAGLGSDVLRALISWGFETWGFMRLAWRCDTENRASRRCAQKAGMLPEGTMRGEYAPSNEARRDTACFGLCYVDFAAQRQA